MTSDAKNTKSAKSAKWVVHVNGKIDGRNWEISVADKDYLKSINNSYGWFFKDKKYLIGHSGGPCNTPVLPFVWDRLIEIANELCEKLNSEGLESIDNLSD